MLAALILTNTAWILLMTWVLAKYMCELRLTRFRLGVEQAASARAREMLSRRDEMLGLKPQRKE